MRETGDRAHRGPRGLPDPRHRRHPRDRGRTSIEDGLRARPRRRRGTRRGLDDRASPPRSATPSTTRPAGGRSSCRSAPTACSPGSRHDARSEDDREAGQAAGEYPGRRHRPPAAPEQRRELGAADRPGLGARTRPRRLGWRRGADRRARPDRDARRRHPARAPPTPGSRMPPASLATPQIRAAGTLGGNLLQRNRCWYYRHPAIELPEEGRRGLPGARRQSPATASASTSGRASHPTHRRSAWRCWPTTRRSRCGAAAIGP